MPQAYLIHGLSTRDDDWFPWLEQAAKKVVKINRLYLPALDHLDPQEWQGACDDQIKPEPGMVLIAHSLGTITTLRYVERHQELADVRLLLVGAFDRPLPLYPPLDSFVEPTIDYSQIRPKVSHATIISAVDDTIVPHQDSLIVAHQLGAKLISPASGNHFLESDGYRQFPLALRELKKLVKA